MKRVIQHFRAREYVEVHHRRTVEGDDGRVIDTLRVRSLRSRSRYASSAPQCARMSSSRASCAEYGHEVQERGSNSERARLPVKVRERRRRRQCGNLGSHVRMKPRGEQREVRRKCERSHPGESRPPTAPAGRANAAQTVDRSPQSQRRRDRRPARAEAHEDGSTARILIPGRSETSCPAAGTNISARSSAAAAAKNQPMRIRHERAPIPRTRA